MQRHRSTDVTAPQRCTSSFAAEVREGWCHVQPGLSSGFEIQKLASVLTISLGIEGQDLFNSGMVFMGNHPAVVADAECRRMLELNVCADV